MKTAADQEKITTDTKQKFECCEVATLPAGTIGIKGKAIVEKMSNPEALYFSDDLEAQEVEFTAIPYALWDNRGTANMAVWIRGK